MPGSQGHNAVPGRQGFQPIRASAPDSEPLYDDGYGHPCPSCGSPKSLYNDEYYYCGCETDASTCPACGTRAFEYNDEGYYCASCDYSEDDD